MSELSGRVRGVVNTPTPAGASGRWSVRAVNKYVGAGVWPPLSLGSFESIATVTVGAGGASSIEFTSIPATYQHLQVRIITKRVGGSTVDDTMLRLGTGGTIDTGTNYNFHQLLGDGSSAAGGGINPVSNIYCITDNSSATSTFGAGVIDILDYASTLKNTTVRIFEGYDANGSGIIFIRSGLWRNTGAVDTIRFYPNTGTGLAEHSTAALYGIKA